MCSGNYIRQINYEIVPKDDTNDDGKRLPDRSFFLHGGRFSSAKTTSDAGHYQMLDGSFDDVQPSNSMFSGGLPTNRKNVSGKERASNVITGRRFRYPGSIYG